MTTQLVTDSINELEPANTVSLALLAERYATNPSVASIRILNAKNQVLATGGLTKTREGEVFVRDAIVNDKTIGRVEITLIQPSIGEILRTQWLAILLSALINALLWLAYRAIARPSRSEYLARINNESRLKHEIQNLTQALEQEKHHAAVAIAQAQQAPQQRLKPKENKIESSEKDTVALSIQFYDPKQLLDSVNQNLSTPYFNLCQLFLTKVTELCIQHFKLNSSDIKTTRKFGEKGAVLTMSTHTPDAVQCLAMIGTVFQLLSDVLYQRYRAEKRFVLQTRSGISTEVETMQLSSTQAAERLVQQLSAKEGAIHVPNELLKQISEHFQLINLPNPTNVLTRHAFMINGVDSAFAELAQQMRTEILKTKQSKAS